MEIPEPETEEAYKLRRQQEPPSQVLQLEDASASGDLDLVKSVFQHREEDQSEKPSLFHFASSFSFTIDGGYLSIATYIIDCGVEFNDAHFQYAMDKKVYPFLELFLDRGFDINMTWSDWAPPLGYKSAFEDEQMIQWLLDHGAKHNTETENGITPISRAVAKAPLSIVQLLLESGGPASVKHGSIVDHDVYRLCSHYLEVIDYVLRYGCQSDINELEYEDRPDIREQTH